MPFSTGKYPLQPYGRITLDVTQCIGCGMCVQVCPMNVYQLDPTRRKVDLICPQHCVNCNACVHR
ncbi:MAG: 4Fe-4S dicluster domain-containing protein [Promethearchaeota archaeon]